MILTHFLSYVGQPELYLPRLRMDCNAFYAADGSWPDAEAMAAWAAKQPPSLVIIDTETGTPKGITYDVPTDGIKTVRAGTDRVRAAFSAGRKANPALKWGLYGALLTDRNGTTNTDPDSEAAQMYRAQQEAHNFPHLTARNRTNGTGLVSSCDVTVLNLYATVGKAKDGLGLAAIIEKNAAIFAKYGKPRVGFISLEYQGVSGLKGDDRFQPWVDVQTQLEACERAGLEYVNIWGGWHFPVGADATRLPWGEVPADLLANLEAWLISRGERLVL